MSSHGDKVVDTLISMSLNSRQENLRLVIGKADAGKRLDRAIADWRELSRSTVLRLLDGGGVLRNGSILSRRDKGVVLQVGDVIDLDKGLGEGERPKADALTPIEVLAAGDGWVAFDKPAGMAVRPHTLDEVGTVVNVAAARFPEIVGVGEGGLRSGVVHRLDNDTSGALLIATEQSAWLRLRRAFSEHRMVKIYEALVCGTPPESGQSTMSLRVARHGPAFVEVCGEQSSEQGAYPCSLRWRVVERYGQVATRVEVDLQTGFLHQVRVMMAAMGYPVIGDTLYGRADDPVTSPRQMLHARSLSYNDVQVSSPLPDDYARVMDELRSGR